MNNLEFALPSGKPQLPPAAPAHIRVLGPNTIQLDLREMDWAEFRVELARRQAAQSDLVVVVEGTDDSDYKAVVNVLELIRKLNITQVGLATASGPALQMP